MGGYRAIVSQAERKGDFLPDLQTQLERRFYATLIDMLTVAAGCYAVVQASGVLLPGGIRGLRVPALALIGVLLVVEGVTGQSLGKLLMALRVADARGGRATILQTAVRAAVRWLAPLISLASVLTNDTNVASLLLAGAMTVVICEVPACYIALFRTGGTIFDLAAKTRVRRAEGG